jgi:hypothetical protein
MAERSSAGRCAGDSLVAKAIVSSAMSGRAKQSSEDDVEVLDHGIRARWRCNRLAGGMSYIHCQ